MSDTEFETEFETDDHRRLREQVREFALGEVAPRIAHMQAHPADVDTHLGALIAQNGWIGATIPTRYGGMGAGHLAKTLIIEELSRVSGAAGMIAQASQLGVAKILHFGSPEQQQTWLPLIAAGECLPTIAVTEPESGGHVLGMRATARRDGHDWVLNGRKVYIGNSHIGHLHGVVTRTDDTTPDPRRDDASALSAFLVEADRPGVHLEPHQPATGVHGFSFGDLVLREVRVPAANMIGRPGDGLAVAYSSSILYGRPNLTAVALGLHQAITELTLRFAQTRRRYGAPLADLPTIQHKIGQLHHRLMTARHLAYQAVHRLDHLHHHPLQDGRPRPCDDELINAKYWGVQAVQDAARTAMSIHGAAGLRTHYPLERLVRDTWHLDAPAGTSDIQLHRLAQTALGGTGHPAWSQRLAHLITPPAPEPEPEPEPERAA
ncbi:acyl-CoA dehydrogenase family protein [Actinomadura litoris]|uniref:Acyl-CoA dehydrogenase n=1 Tax=Actinomadura litoris TaxID=2678616 RepID=A0A7K1LBM7_9ACTN|nr:acyl-CoA dehydrogenase family protein [Actinomadura litoris]MUN41666.1 acyl-CoA dehydrogenase [Actinomadura litoris]